MIQIVPTPTHTTITMPADIFYQLDTDIKPKATYTDNNINYVYITLSNSNYTIFETFLTREKILPL